MQPGKTSYRYQLMPRTRVTRQKLAHPGAALAVAVDLTGRQIGTGVHGQRFIWGCFNISTVLDSLSIKELKISSDILSTSSSSSDSINKSADLIFTCVDTTSSKKSRVQSRASNSREEISRGPSQDQAQSIFGHSRNCSNISSTSGKSSIQSEIDRLSQTGMAQEDTYACSINYTLT